MASKTRQFFLNALSLTATALIIRGVGVIFNVYISNRAGSEAMGLYSLLGSVYGFSITLACAGVNLGTTRLVSDALGLGNIALARKSARKAILFCVVTGAVASLFLFLLSEPIGVGLLGDARAISSLRILATTLIPVAVCSCLSGYFTAVRRVKVNAAFQIIIQLAKIALTAALLSLVPNLDAEAACIALVVGGAISEFISLLITFALYLHDLKKLKMENRVVKQETGTPILKNLIAITLPVTVSACIRSALSMFQHILVPRGLHKSGKSWSAALSSYGALHGMALPLILFPSALVSASAGLLIPEVSEFCVQNDGERLKRVSSRALTSALIFSIGVSGIMLFFSHEFGVLVYHNEETARYIRILAPLIPVMYIDSAADAVLKGSGHQVYSMNINIIDTLSACILALTLIPKIGIQGYIISIYATEMLNTALSLSKMMSVSKFKPSVFHQVAMPIICIIGATNLSKLILLPLSALLGDVAALVLGIIITVLIYVLLLYLTKTIGRDERELIYASVLSEKQYDKKFRSGNALIQLNKKP
jgi:stage V sporulation protein B